MTCRIKLVTKDKSLVGIGNFSAPSLFLKIFTVEALHRFAQEKGVRIISKIHTDWKDGEEHEFTVDYLKGFK